MSVRTAITKALGIGAILCFVLFFSGSLWAILGAMGDRDLAMIMKGITLVTAVCWAFDFILLVILNSVAIISTPESSPTDEPFEPESLRE